ncbi:Uma2 family endonuclease [Candidatus Thiosymbion oneisti]|uniref:Uma2 family endonuclease n=1 Tax=Candidatus Thiosymbion oneisti TaxID=589554 RepID=UPI00210E8FB8|nr:Uma2 family endonuclease [Candidatus Thiosymbion oneisti]
MAMGVAAKHSWISVADYLEGEKIAEVRHEYVNGEVFAMVGTTKAHNRIALNLALLLRNGLAGKPCRVYMENVKVYIKTAFEERFYYPDLHVECRPFTDNSYYSERPKLIIEVLSDSTERDDRSDKFYAYRRLASLEEYVLVAQDEQKVEVYRRSDGWDATVYGPEDSVRLGSVGAELALAAIYA